MLAWGTGLLKLDVVGRSKVPQLNLSVGEMIETAYGAGVYEKRGEGEGDLRLFCGKICVYLSSFHINQSQYTSFVEGLSHG